MFSFGNFSSFIDDIMPDMKLDLKYDLFLPACIQSNFDMSMSSAGSFNSLISSAFDLFSVSEYDSNLLYNKELTNPEEIVAPVRI